MFWSFKVNNSLNGLNNGCFVSAFKFLAHHYVLFLQSLIGNYEVIALTSVLDTSYRVVGMYSHTVIVKNISKGLRGNLGYKTVLFKIVNVLEL